jgi:guanosine-3',5'-bis(diphosphate) 3'-pyrophosphohydrolase
MEIQNRIYTFQDVRAIYSQYIQNPDDLALIEKAYRFADQKHAGQVRKSGDPYITHCFGVAEILAELQVGPKTICAGLLHDTIEDTGTTKEEIQDAFGEEVATLVEALTKVTRLSDYKNVEFTAENHRKIFVAMAKDVRVIIVKLADRLHNMRTLQFQPLDKQIRISKETLDVYAPIAHRLGLYKIQTELEDLSLFYLEPQKYQDIENRCKTMVSDAQGALDKLKSELIAILTPTKIPFEITDRVKSIYSIYKKMYQKDYTSSRFMMSWPSGSSPRPNRTAMKSSATSMPTSNPCLAVSRTTSPCRKPTCISPSIPPLSPIPAISLKSRSVRQDG